MTITTNIENVNEELILILNLFKGHITKKVNAMDLFVQVENNESTVFVSIIKKSKIVFSNSYNYILQKNEKLNKYLKRFAKVGLYQYLSKVCKYKAPWGSLTGIRPTKLFYEILEKVEDKEIASSVLREEYLVSDQKITQVLDIVESQSVVHVDPKSIDLYINIPFCASKCYYCSFISLPLNKCEKLVEPYVNTVIKEIKETLKFIEKKKLAINTVYIGGGTPTSIGVDKLEEILKVLPKNIKELTVEAGRPDSISLEMLDMLNRHNVNRISINPQTFNDKTLKLIGRNHSAQDILEVYKIARNYPFIINMDLIAGLGNEKFTDFKNTLHKTIDLKPDNITVHTLAFKRTSNLSTDGGEVSEVKQVKKMVDYANKILAKFEYKPYYLYRQKNMLGNLENTGYAKDGKICEFNINSMEETLSVIACGANAISKRIFYDTNCIERHANVKNIEQYIDRIDEMMEKKFDLFNK